jgi:hypothetical protein
VNLDTSATNQAAGSTADRIEPDNASDTSLPLAYGSDRLVLMVRDPTWAQAYWDMSVARIEAAIRSLGRGKALLRLLAMPTGYLLGEHEVPGERGSYGVELREADRSYAVELAIVNHGLRVVIARSNVVRAPRIEPRPEPRPAFVSRADQRHALGHGLTLARRAQVAPHGVPAWVEGPSGGTQATTSPIWFFSPDSIGLRGASSGPWF